MKKDIYFIRHGETLMNSRHVHQHYDEPLSEEGQGQAQVVAEFVKTLGITELITSPFTRARQTATYIGELLDLPYTIDTVVHETIRPSYLYGTPHFSFSTYRYISNLFLHRLSDVWNDNDGENMFDVRNRVHDAKDMIMELESDSMAIVSHAVFIDMFIHLVCAENGMNIFRFVHMVAFMKRMPNTSIAHIQYSPDAPVGVCQWQFIQLITPKEFDK